MHTATTVLEESAPVAIWIRTGVDSRPRAHRWQPGALIDRVGWAQPSLLDGDLLDSDLLESGLSAPPPRPTGVRFWSDGAGTLRPAPGLPDPAEWTAVLALAVAQALHGLRPAGQLERWLSEPVLVDLRRLIRLRQRRYAAGRRASRTPPIRVASVRAQCPTPNVVEATAHVRVAGRSLAVAARLESLGDRWLCVALELGPPLD